MAGKLVTSFVKSLAETASGLKTIKFGQVPHEGRSEAVSGMKAIKLIISFMCQSADRGTSRLKANKEAHLSHLFFCHKSRFVQ